jgi:hypothetical protein
MKLATTTLIALLLLPTLARAKAAFYGKAHMVKESAAILVVDITAVDPAQEKGRHWTYAQKATGKIETVLKGDGLKAGETIALHGMEDFICAQCRFATGRHLLFLDKDGTLWTGSNWHLSIRPVISTPEKAHRVEWYKSNEGIELTAQLLDDVLADVRKLLASPAK